jgi:hypothetical protein
MFATSDMADVVSFPGAEFVREAGQVFGGTMIACRRACFWGREQSRNIVD